MVEFKKESDILMLVNNKKVIVEERIFNLLKFEEVGVVMTKAGNVLIYNKFGKIIWEYDRKNCISEIWKKDDNTFCMYDGQADIWVDINKLKVVRIIWNPWGLNKNEKCE